jgi:cell division protein FtsN
MPAKKTKKKNKTKKYHVEFSFTSLLCWILGLFFLLAWIFVLGILVGRGFLPESVRTLSELKAPIAKLQNMVGTKKKTDLEEIKNLDENPRFAFYDELASKKEKTIKRHFSQDKKKISGFKPDKDSSEKKVYVSDTEEKQGSEKPDGLPEKNPAPTQHVTANLPGSEGTYTLQLASLERKSQAEKYTNSLLDRGYPAYFYEADIKGKTYYRVRCGLFKTRKEAQAFATQLAEEENIKGYVTRVE